MFKLDTRYKPKDIRVFAKKLDELSKESQNDINLLFANDQSDEFYVGLFNGLAAALVLLQNKKESTLPAIVAAAASKLERLEIL